MEPVHRNPQWQHCHFPWPCAYIFSIFPCIQSQSKAEMIPCHKDLFLRQEDLDHKHPVVGSNQHACESCKSSTGHTKRMVLELQCWPGMYNLDWFWKSLSHCPPNTQQLYS